MDVNRNDQYTLPFGGNWTAGYYKGYKTNASYNNNIDDYFASACGALLAEAEGTKPEETETVSGAVKTAEAGVEEKKSLLQQMQEHMALMREKIKNGTIQPTFQTGAQSFTKEEWEKLLEKFDEAEEILRAEIEAEIEAVKESAQKEELTDGAERVEVTGETGTGAAAAAAEPTAEVRENAAADGMDFVTEEITRCTYPSANPDEKRWYITCYTKEGISCKESVYDGTSWTTTDFWSIRFTQDGQYERVLAFLNRFPSDGNLRFAAHENFWQDFLAGDLDEDAFVAFFETTKDGVPDYTITDGDSTYIDKDKVKWAKYMNSFGAQFYTEEEILAWQDAIIRENQKKLNKLSDYDGALQRPDDVGDKRDEEEERTEIITRPDGTKILQIITSYGVTSFEIAKGQELSLFPAYVKAVYEKTNGTADLPAPERKA